MEQIRDSYIDVAFQGTCNKLTIFGTYQYDHGLKLRISGIQSTQLPQIQFSHRGWDKALTVIPTSSDGIIISDIPDVQLCQSKDIICYIYVEDDTSGVTIKEISIPITPRAKPANSSFTPAQIDNYNSLVTQLNTLIKDVDETKDGWDEMVKNAEDATEDANQAAESAKEISDKFQNLTLIVDMIDANKEASGTINQTETSTAFHFNIPSSNFAYATFDVNENDGCLYMISPEGFSGTNFHLTDDGELCVVV